MAPAFGSEHDASPEAAAAAIDVIRGVAPEVLLNAAPAKHVDGGMRIGLDNGSIFATEAGRVHVDVNGTRLTMTIPEAGSVVLERGVGAIMFGAESGVTTSIFANQGNAVTAITTIPGSTSPKTFSYVYSGIDEIREAPDGGLSIWKGGQNIGFFMLPWALDASGAEVPTYYEVDGLTLTQVVEHTEGDFEYPIAADPSYYLGSNSLYWATMNTTLDPHGVVIQVVPQPNINWGHMARSNGIPPYDQLVPAAYRTNAMHDQLVCHWTNAGYFKVPWNLDSWRPDVGYWNTVWALCNP
jgi:hypothetical protein